MLKIKYLQIKAKINQIVLTCSDNTNKSVGLYLMWVLYYKWMS